MSTKMFFAIGISIVFLLGFSAAFKAPAANAPPAQPSTELVEVSSSGS